MKAIISPIISGTGIYTPSSHEGYSDDPASFSPPPPATMRWTTQKLSQKDVDAASGRLRALYGRLLPLANEIKAIREALADVAYDTAEWEVARYGFPHPECSADQYTGHMTPADRLAYALSTHLKRRRAEGGGRKPKGPGMGRDAPRHTVQCSDAAWQRLRDRAVAEGHRSLAAWGEAMAAKSK